MCKSPVQNITQSLQVSVQEPTTHHPVCQTCPIEVHNMYYKLIKCSLAMVYLTLKYTSWNQLKIVHIDEIKMSLCSQEPEIVSKVKSWKSSPKRLEQVLLEIYIIIVFNKMPYITNSAQEEGPRSDMHLDINPKMKTFFETIWLTASILVEVSAHSKING